MNRRIFIIFALAVTGCAWIDGTDNHAQFEFRASADSENSCLAKQFPQKFIQFETIEPTDGIAQMSMYESVAQKLSRNYLTIQFVARDAQTLESCPSPKDLIGKTVNITSDGCVRASFILNECRPRQIIRIVGSLTLDKYTDERGRRVAGSIDGTLQNVERVEKVSGIYQEIVTDLGGIAGDFSYDNREGAVWRD